MTKQGHIKQSTASSPTIHSQSNLPTISINSHRLFAVFSLRIIRLFYLGQTFSLFFYMKNEGYLVTRGSRARDGHGPASMAHAQPPDTGRPDQLGQANRGPPSPAGWAVAAADQVPAAVLRERPQQAGHREGAPLGSVRGQAARGEGARDEGLGGERRRQRGERHRQPQPNGRNREDSTSLYLGLLAAELGPVGTVGDIAGGVRSRREPEK